jgi:DNA-binding NarL/FixJ family response regulator
LIRILLADDQALIRSGIRSLLEAEDDDEIAETMVLSPATVKTHVSRAMIKLGARDRAQLVVFAYQTGLVSPRAPGH